LLKLVPSVVVAVIVAVPTFNAVIFPFASTFTIVGSLDVQFTFLFIALSGVTVAIKVSVCPTGKESVYLFNDIASAAIPSGVKSDVCLAIPTDNLNSSIFPSK